MEEFISQNNLGIGELEKYQGLERLEMFKKVRCFNSAGLHICGSYNAVTIRKNKCLIINKAVHWLHLLV